MTSTCPGVETGRNRGITSPKRCPARGERRFGTASCAGSFPFAFMRRFFAAGFYTGPDFHFEFGPRMAPEGAVTPLLDEGEPPGAAPPAALPFVRENPFRAPEKLPPLRSRDG